MGYKIFELENIYLNLEIDKKEELLKMIAQTAFERGICDNKEQILAGLNERETIATTNLGKSICIPHTKNEAIINPSIFIFRLNKSIIWNDGEDEIKMAIALLMPKESLENIHMKVLTSLSRKLIYDDFIKNLLEGESKEDIYSLIKESLSL